MVTLIILVLLFNLTAFFVPKRRTKIELYIMALFGVLFAMLADTFLVEKYYAYWYFQISVDWPWLIPLFGGKPAISVLFANYFPVSSRFLTKVIYILLGSVILTIFEWLLVHVGGVLYYRLWSIWVSAISYPFILAILAANLYFVRHLLKSNRWF